MTKPKLHVVTVSTRPGRKGPKVAAWFVEQATKHDKFDVRAVDLAEVALPLFDEPKHPRLGQYEHAHTRKWSALVDEADAFVFVSPEYNFSTPVPLLNALTFLAREWAYCAAGLVSYGGVSAGLRAAQATKLTLTSFKVMPLPEAVSIPFFDKLIKEDGSFDPGAVQEKAATLMLDELAKWTEALRPLRAANRNNRTT